MRRAALVVCGFAALSACSAELVSGLDERQAEHWISRLRDAGVDARRTRDGEGMFSVYVAKRDTPLAVRSLLQDRFQCPHDAPRPALLPSLSDQRAERARQMGNDLELELAMMRGVVSAHVQISLAEPPVWASNGEGTPAAASALLEYDGAATPLTPAELAAFVAGAVPGLMRDQVQVVLKSSARLETATQALERLGPVTMTRASLDFARATLLAGLGLLFASGGLMLTLWWRLKKASTSFPPS